MIMARPNDKVIRARSASYLRDLRIRARYPLPIDYLLQMMEPISQFLAAATDRQDYDLRCEAFTTAESEAARERELVVKVEDVEIFVDTRALPLYEGLRKPIRPADLVWTDADTPVSQGGTAL